MEHELGFPNPVERTDLPIPRKKWKYVAAGLAMVLALALAFLPQVMSSPLGKKILKMRIESAYRGKVWIESLKTSWGGPTLIGKFSFTDDQGREIRFDSLRSSMGVFGLLLGKVDLKDATIAGLHAEYVVDYGDGSDMIDRLSPGYVPGMIADPEAPPPPPHSLPAIAGNITLKDATFVLTRGEILAQRQFRSAYRSARFSHINGAIHIQSLETPLDCDLKGRVGEGAIAGTFELKGKLSLGADGKLDAKKATSDLWLSMQNVPNSAAEGAGSLGWIMLPALSAEDYGEMLGPTLSRLEMNIQASGGKVKLSKFEAVGRTRAGKTTRVSGTPLINMLSRPRMLEVEGITTASVQMTRELSHKLAYLNPFLHEAQERTGELDLVIEQLSLPLAGRPTRLSARGTMTVKDVQLASGPAAPGNTAAQDLVMQWQAVTGDLSPVVRMNQGATRFEISNGVARSQPTPITLDMGQVVLDGPVYLNGMLKLAAQIGLPQGAQTAAIIGGTVEEPTLELTRPSTAMKQDVERNLLALRERRNASLLQDKQSQVEAILRDADRVNPEGRVPGTQPAWERKMWGKKSN